MTIIVQIYYLKIFFSMLFPFELNAFDWNAASEKTERPGSRTREDHQTKIDFANETVPEVKRNMHTRPGYVI